MTKVALSVVIPSYNHGQYIGAALDSVRDQTLPPGEVIVVDDGSSDSSVDVIRSHDVPGLRLITQENRGAHVAINRAIEASTGDYIAILNSDDLYEPGHLEYAMACGHFGLAFGCVTLIDQEGELLPDDHEVSRWYTDARYEASKTLSAKEAVRPHNVAMTTSNFVLHRALWSELGGFRGYRYVHDYDFLLRALEVCPERVWYHRDFFGVRYRIHPSNTIAENVELALGEREQMLASHRGFVRRARVFLSSGVVAPRVRAAINAPAAGIPGVAREASSESRLKVGIATPSLDRGGLEEIVSTLALGLVAEGCDISIVCTERGGAAADRLSRAMIPVQVAPSNADLERWAADVDVVSSHFLGLESVRSLAGHDVPIVETVHNTFGWFHESDWVEAREKDALLADVIAVSVTAARYYERHVPSERALEVIPNSVDPIRAATLPWLEARAWHHPGALFVFLGRLTEQKNIGGLVAAFADVPEELDARLRLVGPDREGVGQQLRRQYPDLIESNRLRIEPPVDGLSGILSAADAFVANSFYEGWSVSASEALWTGAALVLSECGGAVELAGEEGERGVVVPNALGDPLSVSPAALADPPSATVQTNHEAMTRALSDFAANIDEWRASREARRAWARSELAPERMATQYLEVLSQAARKPVG